jgi:hypothetical protein
MAKGPKREPLVTCDCPECRGAKIDQTAYLRHSGETKSGMAKMPDRVWMMGKWWRQEHQE